MDNQLIPHTEKQRLAFLNTGLRAIAEANTLEDVKQIRDQSEALRVYAAQSAASNEAQNIAAEIKIRAERKAGELLKERESNKGAATPSRAVTPSPLKLEDLGIGRMQSSRWQQAATLPKEQFESYIEETKQSGGEITSAGVQRLAKGKPHVSHNSGVNEWYTPSKFIESARYVMGSIDCDPASSERANEIVKATTHYTINDNGLDQSWGGNIWMNPPYSKDLISEFVDKLLYELEADSTRQAITLVNNATETQWFQELLKDADGICFPSSRIKFIDIEGKPSGSPLQGQSILYFGDYVETFCEEFEQHGLSLIVCYHD